MLSPYRQISVFFRKINPGKEYLTSFNEWIGIKVINFGKIHIKTSYI